MNRSARARVLAIALSVVVCAPVVAASAAPVISPSAAHSASGSLVGQRAKVKVKQLLVYKQAGRGSYIGSLLKGDSFKVRKLSHSGKWAFGYAYGNFKHVGWVKTSGLSNASAAAAPEARLAGSPRLYTVRGDVGVGRPTRYVTFKTVNGISARLLVATVSGSSGRTYNADDGIRRSRKCFRSAMQPYQRTPEPRRLKPGVAYKVRFYTRPSLNGKRTLFATRTLYAHSFFPRTTASGGQSAPSPC